MEAHTFLKTLRDKGVPYTETLVNLMQYAVIEEVAPVVHAHWVNHKNNYVSIDFRGDVSESAFCSNCREWLTASDEYATRGKYCPNCGAKMDEVVG